MAQKAKKDSRVICGPTWPRQKTTVESEGSARKEMSAVMPLCSELPGTAPVPEILSLCSCCTHPYLSHAMPMTDFWLNHYGLRGWASHHFGGKMGERADKILGSEVSLVWENEDRKLKLYSESNPLPHPTSYHLESLSSVFGRGYGREGFEGLRASLSIFLGFFGLALNTKQED